MIAGEIRGDGRDRTPGPNRLDGGRPHAGNMLNVRPTAKGGLRIAKADDAVSHLGADLRQQAEFIGRRVVQTQFDQGATPSGFNLNWIGLRSAPPPDRLAQREPERRNDEQDVNDHILQRPTRIACLIHIRSPDGEKVPRSTPV